MRERADNARPIETATQDPTHWQAEADFVVIGSGAAGLMAALSASEAGKSVVLLERSEKIGGTTAFSGALLWVPLNPKGKEIGFIDDRDAAISYILATMGQSADRTRVEAFVDSAGETIEFLERHSPIQLLNTPYPDTFIEAVGGVASGRHLEPAYFSLRKLGAWRHRLRKPANPAMFTFREMIAQGFVAGLKRIIFRNIHAIVWRLIAAKRCGGTALVAAMLKACLDRGVIVHTISRVVKLIVKNDRVIGVETQSARFSANRAVILASGGFEQNAEMVAEFLPAPMEHLPTPPGLATGDNVDLALQVGAALDRMDTSWNWPSSQIPGKEHEGSAIGDLMLGERMLPHSLWVNKHGERFCNEAAHNVAFAFEQRDAQGSLLNVPAWAILDSQYRAKYPLLFKYMPGSKDPGWLIKGWHPWRASGKDRSRCRSATANHFSLQCKRTGRKGSGLRPRAKWL